MQNAPTGSTLSNYEQILALWKKVKELERRCCCGQDSVALGISGGSGISTIVSSETNTGANISLTDLGTGLIAIDSDLPIFLAGKLSFELSNGTNVAAPILGITRFSDTRIIVNTRDVANSNANIDGTINVRILISN